MEEKKKISSMDYEYYVTGNWRCVHSPTLAHHWKLNGTGVWKCKYCEEERKFSTIRD